MVADRTTWAGDWQSRIVDRTVDLGYSDPRQFLERNADATYTELAQMLSTANERFAPVQLQHLHVATCDELTRDVQMRNSLFRLLREALGKRGWGELPHWEVRVIGALVSWSAMWGDTDATRAVKKRLMGNPPERGWKPQSAEDSVLQRLWAAC